MKIERPGDLIYLTYFMLDWGKVEQTDSDQRCTKCGGALRQVEPAIDPKGNRYDGLVCHSCKQVIWARSR
jgi:uncharacterized protein with PIN domain